MLLKNPRRVTRQSAVRVIKVLIRLTVNRVPANGLNTFVRETPYFGRDRVSRVLVFVNYSRAQPCQQVFGICLGKDITEVAYGNDRKEGESKVGENSIA